MKIYPAIPSGFEHETVQNLVHTLPESQLLWLSGYFYGVATAKTGLNGGAVPLKVVLPKITILYATQSGNSKKAANLLSAKMHTRGWQWELLDMNEYPVQRLKSEQLLFLVVSTYGDGEPPVAAEALYEFVRGKRAPQLPDLRFSVLALGDKGYLQFCQTGVDFDAALSKLGGKRLTARVDCDVDFLEDAERWCVSVVEAIAAEYESVGASVKKAAPAVSSTVVPKFDRKNPFEATVLEKIQLNGRGSSKETYHLELSLEGSGLTYQPGDALGIQPTNSERLVAEVLKVTGFHPATTLDNSVFNLGEFLLNEVELSVLNLDLLRKYAEWTQNVNLQKLIQDKKQLQAYCYGRDVVDLLTDFPAQQLTPQVFAQILRKIPARLYSIASSLEMYPNEVHLTIGAVRYQTHGRKKEGVCSSGVADRMAVGEKAKIFIEHNEFFKLPKNGDTPIIMLGAGTGIAPFRAFLQERQARGAKGKNGLFFGNPNFATDFLYQLEWQQALKKGDLAYLEVAFSRDQTEKVYIQHRLLEKSKQIFDWLEQGAYCYVCGDKNRMAQDVEQAFIKIVCRHAGFSEEKAWDYVKNLKKQRRYLEDVY